VIVATEVLSSMESKDGTPKRPEATDINTAVNQFTDAMMLSGETSSGDQPVNALRAMGWGIRTAESKIDYRSSDP